MSYQKTRYESSLSIKYPLQCQSGWRHHGVHLMDVRLISAVFVCLFSFLHTAPAHSATDLNQAINTNAATGVTYVNALSFGAVGDGVADDIVDNEMVSSSITGRTRRI